MERPFQQGHMAVAFIRQDWRSVGLSTAAYQRRFPLMTMPIEMGQKFIEIWKDEFGEGLTFEEGSVDAIWLVELAFMTVHPPDRADAIGLPADN